MASSMVHSSNRHRNAARSGPVKDMAELKTLWCHGAMKCRWPALKCREERAGAGCGTAAPQAADAGQ